MGVLEANRLQRFFDISRPLANVRLAMVRGTDTGDIGQHVLAPFSERHNVIPLDCAATEATEGGVGLIIPCYWHQPPASPDTTTTAPTRTLFAGSTLPQPSVERMNEPMAASAWRPAATC
jgi:hypothetical protein